MDLSLIKQEIESRKKEKSHIAESAGIDMPMAKDNFLHSLQESLATGVPNKATAKVKVVADRSNNMDVAGGQVINKNATPVNEQVLQTMAQPQQPPQQNFNQPQHPQYPVNPNMMNPNVNPNALDPREEQFYRNLQETKQMLGTSNVGMADALAMYQKPAGQANQGQQMITNPNALNEAVKHEVQNFMANIDLSRMVEDAVKHTMMEMYQKEKVEIAINENKDVIQKMVVNTILALKKRNQQKK